jgi:hypothetical protein
MRHGGIHTDVTGSDLRVEKDSVAREAKLNARRERTKQRAAQLAALPRCRKLMLRAIEKDGSSHCPRLWAVDGTAALYVLAWSGSGIETFDEASKRRVWLVQKFESIEELLNPRQGG